MTPPPTLVKALAAHDSRLRCRWAKASRQWFIERRMPERHPDFMAELRPPVAETEGMEAAERATARLHADRYESLQAGYWPAFTVPRAAIFQTERVMTSLREWDGHQGGFAAINARLDASQAQWEAARRKERDDFTLSKAEDAWEHGQWQSGNRIATSDMAEGAESSDVTEQREGYSVRVRKATHALAEAG